MADVKEGNSEGDCTSTLTPKKFFKPKFPLLWIFGKAEEELNCSNSLFEPSENQILKNGDEGVEASSGNGLNFGIQDSTDYAALAKGETPPLYYGVSLPSGTLSTDDSEEPLVFSDKKEALRIVKKYKGARFKVFQNEEDAATFASLPADEICPTPKAASSTEVPENEKNPSWFLDLLASTSIKDLALKPDPFRGPKSQDMVKLRKAIESGDKDYFLQTVWSNPRYLISSCDTPAIMQEGFRYNGLHVAAKHKQPELCRLILETIEDPAFIELLYREDTESCRSDRQNYVLDLYLNTPDRGLCETPLHFASKFGCLEAVEIIAFHKRCDKKRKNKYGLEAREIICERCPSASPELKKKIEAIFEEHVFVPVYRSEDNSVQPIVGEPYSLNDPRVPYVHTPVINADSPLDTSRSVVAVAGPLSPEDASDLYQQWKTPSSTLLPQEASLMSRIRLSDPDKGLERIGRYLARSIKASWTEYWPCLEGWCDLSSKDGLQKLEDHLKYWYDWLSLESDREQRLRKQDLMNSDFQPNDFNTSPILSKSTDLNLNNISSSSSGSSGISSLCHRMEDLDLSDSDDSLLKTSPDMPRVLRSHHDPFEQLDSPPNSSCITSTNEVLHKQAACEGSRQRLRDLSELHFQLANEKVSLNKSCTRKSGRRKPDHAEEKMCMLFKKESNFSTPKTNMENSECIINEHYSEGVNMPDSVISASVIILVKNMVQVFSELLINSDANVMPQTTLHKFLTDDVLPHVKSLRESILGTNCKKETVHCDIAVKVYRQIQNIFMVHEVRLIMQYLAAYLESKFSNTSSDDESDNRKRPFMESKSLSTSNNAMWKQLMCILVFLNTFLLNSDCINNISLTACQCMWQNNENLPKVEVNEQVAIKQNPSENEPNHSSDEEYVTPPGSPEYSSTPEEPSTPDEGLEIYVEGALPSKADADVLRAVENVSLDPSRFPHVYRWKHLMSSYDKEVIESWPSPSRRKYHEGVVRVKSRTPYRAYSLSPSREISDLNLCFTPVRNKAENRPPFQKTLNSRSLYKKFLALEEKE